MRDRENNKRIIIVAGPTAVGKTEYAIRLAELLNGEIVSADSMQLYRYMDIGSAKPTPEEQARVKHYLVDQVDPREPFSVAVYQKKAKAAIQEIFQKGKLPVISGGTGLYVNSLIYSMDFSSSVRDEEYRLKLEQEAKLYGKEAVHKKLQALDPQAASRIHPNNIKKVIRALEVAESGEKIPDFEHALVPTADYQCLLLGLERDRQELYERIDRRVDLLLEAGLEKEIRSLLAMGLTEENISMKGIGYKEIIGYLDGRYPKEEAVRLVKRNTRHYAKRQMTWFKRIEEMKWFQLSQEKNSEDSLREIAAYVKEESK